MSEGGVTQKSKIGLIACEVVRLRHENRELRKARAHAGKIISTLMGRVMALETHVKFTSLHGQANRSESD